MTTEIIMLYVTCASREQALEIAHVLVSRGLVACANMVEGVTSVYRWQGELEQAREVLLLAKTTIAKTTTAIETIRQMHCYELPGIIVLPVMGGLPAYLSWVEKEVS